MNFRYRYVRFGTHFTRSEAPRTEARRDPNILHENELALDVGGSCWGVAAARREDVELAVIDHHFHRDSGQFPAAAAAVLYLAPKIAERFQKRDGDLWLVTHEEPDFDAFCSMYLARRVIEDATHVSGDGTADPGRIPVHGWDHHGLWPGGWRRKPEKGEESRQGYEIDWFNPSLRGLPDCRRWPLLLAAVASCVDNGRRLACPKNRALHSVLYAALKRGREYTAEESGAVEFFHAVLDAMNDSAQRLNPLTDSVLEKSPTFAPEMMLLDHELSAYERDIQRARKAVVFLRESSEPYGAWFPAVQAQSLVNADRSLNPAQLLSEHGGSQADGIYVRDPECLLFKEWARVDHENSSAHQGFLFTAIAYSNGRRGAAANETEYFFSIDPERAARRHLYNVWAALQYAEVGALRGSQGGDRTGFEDRARNCKGYLDDPWYDGQNYQATIVATPGRGTALAPAGHETDLSDDPVARIVRHTLEHSIFAGPVKISDIAASPSAKSKEWDRMPVEQAPEAITTPDVDTYRFGRTLLADEIDTFKPAMVEQIGGVLWRLLNPDGGEGGARGVPEGHIVSTADGVAVWGQRGMIVAPKKSAVDQADRVEEKFRELAKLASDLKVLLDSSISESASTANGSETHPEDDHDADVRRLARIKDGENLMRRVIQFEHGLALLHSRLLRFFFEANRLGEVLDGAREMSTVELDRARNERIDDNIATVAEVQKTTHWIETFVVAFYTVELFDVVGKAFEFPDPYIAVSVLIAAFFTGLTMLYVLRPWADDEIGQAGYKRSHNPLMGAFLVIVALLVAVYVGVGLYYPRLKLTFEQTRQGQQKPAKTSKSSSKAPPLSPQGGDAPKKGRLPTPRS